MDSGLFLRFAVRVPDLVTNRIGDLHCLRIASKVSSDDTSLAYPLHGFQELRAGIPFTQPGQHLGACPEGGDGVGNPFPRDIERGTVYRLKHTGVLSCWVQVGGRRDANRPSQRRCQVGKNVCVLVMVS